MPCFLTHVWSVVLAPCQNGLQGHVSPAEQLHSSTDAATFKSCRSRRITCVHSRSTAGVDQHGDAMGWSPVLFVLCQARASVPRSVVFPQATVELQRFLMLDILRLKQVALQNLKGFEHTQDWSVIRSLALISH